MLYFIKKKAFIGLLSLFNLVFFVNEVFAASDLISDPATGLNKTKGVPGVNKLAGVPNIPTAIGNVIGIALSLVGVVFLILIIYGGALWMTAQGNDQQISKAKSLITQAVIGLIIVVSAYGITTFVSDILISS